LGKETEREEYSWANLELISYDIIKTTRKKKGINQRLNKAMYFASLIIHEITHIGIEQSIINTYVSQALKERIVGYFCVF
jgi:hypothetical protein